MILRIMQASMQNLSKRILFSMNKLSLVGMQLLEKYKENFGVSSEGPPCGVNSRRRAFARNVEILLIFFS